MACHRSHRRDAGTGPSLTFSPATGRRHPQAGRYAQRWEPLGVLRSAGLLDPAQTAGLDQAVHAALSQEFLTLHGGKVQKAFRVDRFDVGKWSGTVPIGYRMGYTDEYNAAKGTTEPIETGVLLPDTRPQPLIGFGEIYTRADLVRLIGETYATGRFGFRPLAAQLNLLGYRNSKGEPFSGSAIRVIVSNPVYIGRIGWHKRPDKERKAHAFYETEWKQGPHEPLWSEALWDPLKPCGSGPSGARTAARCTTPTRFAASPSVIVAADIFSGRRTGPRRVARRSCTWHARLSASATTATSVVFARHDSRTKSANGSRRW